MGEAIDFFDPRTWSRPSSHEYRIYLDNRAAVWAVVDEIDYQWAIQWLWMPGQSRSKHKFYARRTETRRVQGVRFDTSIFLHVAIMDRAQPEPPSLLHTISDHRNGDTMDCRRSNLRWATPSMNRVNLYGQAAYELMEDHAHQPIAATA